MRIAGGEAEWVLLLFLVGVLGAIIFGEVLDTVGGEVVVKSVIKLAWRCSFRTFVAREFEY